MTHPTAQRLQQGTYRCPTCGATYEALGTETAIICTGGDRHRATQMQPTVDADSREKRTA